MQVDNNISQQNKYNNHVDLDRYNPGYVVTDSGFHGIKFDFNYGARVLIPDGEDFHVKIIDKDSYCTVFETTTHNSIVSSNKKYYVNYRIEVSNEHETYVHDMNLFNKNVHIIIPTRAIGDAIAWIPYVEEFRIVHKCNVYVSVGMHIRELLSNSYKELIFLEDEDVSVEYYATYMIGVFFPIDDRDYQPSDFRFYGLQKAAANILGLPLKEIKAKIRCAKERTVAERYVCIGVQSTTQCKTWNNPNGWIRVIQYLKQLGYRVLCIDKDRVYGDGRLANVIPYGCEDFTGNISLQERANLLVHADFFIGCSSGLSWLAWACGIPVVVIGGFTLPFNEFNNPYRVINYNVCNGCWHEVEFQNNDYGWCPRFKNTEREFECSRAISSGYVIKTIDRLIENNKYLR